MAKLDMNACQTTQNVAPETDSLDSMEGEVEVDMTLEDYVDDLIERVEALEQENKELRYATHKSEDYQRLVIKLSEKIYPDNEGWLIPLESLTDKELQRDFISSQVIFAVGSFGRSDIDYDYALKNELGKRGITEDSFREEMDKEIAGAENLMRGSKPTEELKYNEDGPNIEW